MDRFAKKQAQISQHRAEASARYPALWSNMIADWNSPSPDDRAWLLYFANYLFCTDDVRCWVIPESVLTLIQNQVDLPSKQVLIQPTFAL
jgi:hypothetical protein